MTARNKDFPDDQSAPERRRNLSEQQVEDLELAGGVEGGMQAGSAGGPGSKDVGKPEAKTAPSNPKLD